MHLPAVAIGKFRYGLVLLERLGHYAEGGKRDFGGRKRERHRDVVVHERTKRNGDAPERLREDGDKPGITARIQLQLPVGRFLVPPDNAVEDTRKEKGDARHLHNLVRRESRLQVLDIRAPRLRIFGRQFHQLV